MTEPTRTTREVLVAWKGRYQQHWSSEGAGVTAADYAYIVIEQRLGRRSSLSYGYFVGSDDKRNRRQIRSQVDSVLREGLTT